jgi:excinuclease ABC subunit A
MELPGRNAIVVRGAREHNLKNIGVAIPRERLVVVTGISGSGKSSLAIDTIYAEGQRRYVESLSAYARQFLEQMGKPDVDAVEGLSPAIAIDQRGGSRNPRSTVGTVTEIYDFVRLLFARVGRPHCFQCGRPITAQTVEQMVDRLHALGPGSRIQVFAPVARDRKGEYRKELLALRKAGFVRARIDGEIRDLGENIVLARTRKHTIEVLVDRLVLRDGIERRLADSLEVALRYGGDVVRVEAEVEGQGEGGKPAELVFSQRYACPECGVTYPELSPRIFSFNSPHGACPSCSGLGTTRYFDPDLLVPDASLSLRDGALAVSGNRALRDLEERLEGLAGAAGLDPSTAFGELSAEARQRFFFGTARQGVEGTQPGAIDHVKASARGRGRPADRVEGEPEGLVGFLERVYRETSSQWLREELERYMSARPCQACAGTRLRPESRFVRVGERSIDAVMALPVGQAVEFFGGLLLAGQEAEIARPILKEILDRFGFLASVGLDYLTLDRPTASLSGGESQRIRLATQVGASLVGVLYVLDEPSVGLHQRDNERLLATLTRLRDLGNTVLVVEHDRDTILAADHVIDMGPGAGTHGGRIVAEGSPREIMETPASLTGRYLRGDLEIPVPAARRPGIGWRVEVRGARHNNLKRIDVALPLGTLTCVTGVSGSGKSSLVVDTLYPALAHRLHGAADRAGAHDEIDGWQLLDKVVEIDQAPIGRSPRSNPATYTGLFGHIRELFAQVPEARTRGYGPGRFSFNVKGGRCEACMGDGLLRIEMHFLPDVYVTCEVCRGKRYNRETLEVTYKGLNIAEVLDLTVADALDVLGPVPPARQKLETLREVGLDYVRLGQGATTLSGGEAQRVKLARELGRRATGRTIYMLDEPTTGLHFDDVRRLLAVLQRLVDAGNTVVVIEHNLDVIKSADYVIDLGPEGGERGGRVVAAGTPEEVAANDASFTGAYLRPLLRGALQARTPGGHARNGLTSKAQQI